MSGGTLNLVEEVLNLQAGDKAGAKTNGDGTITKKRRLRGEFK